MMDCGHGILQVECVWEHSGDDTLLYACSHPGAFARGASLAEALSKMPREIALYNRWRGHDPGAPVSVRIVQEKQSALDIRDADSDVLFDTERGALSAEEYASLKALALKSAQDFHALYASMPDVRLSVLPARTTFYGRVPRTAEEMYRHTKGVNTYYFGEIGVDADDEGSILSCRERGFEALEKKPGYRCARVVDGSYGEQWSLRKVLRRFLWHDRIHARAMYRMGVATFGAHAIADPFGFDGNQTRPQSAE